MFAQTVKPFKYDNDYNTNQANLIDQRLGLAKRTNQGVKTDIE